MRISITAAQKFHIFVILFTIPFLMGTAVDLYVPSLPAITEYFHVPESAVQFTISFYMLGYAIGQIFLGVLSDSLGRKKIVIICGVFFIIVSAAASHAPNIYALIFYRFLQGVTIAGPGAIVRAMASDCFSGLELNKAVAYYSMSWALGPIIGPFIGGYLQHYFGWQANFYFFAFYAMVTFAYAILFLPETHLERVPLHPVKLYQVVKSVVMHPVFILSSMIGSLIYAILVIFNVFAPFLVQVELHYSAIDYGHIALVMGLAYFIGNFINRLIVHRFDPAKLTFNALIIALIMSLFMVLLGFAIKQNLFILVLPAFLIFLMCGFILPNTGAKCLSLFPGIAGTASAVFGSFGILGVFVLTSMATLLPTHTQTPLALLYFSMVLVSLWLFLITKKLTAPK